jgi:gliding motility-associated-like protein
MKKIKALYYSLFCSIILFSNIIHGQFFSQDVVGSAGTYIGTSYASMAWTIGEVTIETYSGDAIFFTQGFHQPSEKDILVDLDFFIPEGFSPNGDLVNDVFFIRGIAKYPNNSIVIFNRWGDKLFEASPYLNDWDGTSKFGITLGSDELPVGTYFYLFDFGNGFKVLKGTIYLNK